MNIPEAYLNYREDIKYLAHLPLWKRQLYNYQTQPSAPITLPDTSMEAAHKALEALPPVNTDPEYLTDL